MELSDIGGWWDKLEKCYGNRMDEKISFRLGKRVKYQKLHQGAVAKVDQSSTQAIALFFCLKAEKSAL